MAQKSKRSLQDVVGKETYSVWVDMLRTLVPGGRTHRVSVVVAGMKINLSGNNLLKSVPKIDITTLLMLYSPYLIQITNLPFKIFLSRAILERKWK